MADRVGGGLVSQKTGAAVSLRTGRGPIVLVAVESTDCAACADYVAQLRDALARAPEWGARLVVVQASGDRGCRFPAPDGIEVLMADDIDSVIGSAPPVVAVADEWGEIHFNVRATADHDLPSAEDIVDWTRYVAIQCPECEQPEGEWRSL